MIKFKNGMKVSFKWGSYKSIGTIKDTWKTKKGVKFYDVKVWNNNLHHYNVYPLNRKDLTQIKKKRR